MTVKKVERWGEGEGGSGLDEQLAVVEWLLRGARAEIIQATRQKLRGAGRAEKDVLPALPLTRFCWV